MKREISLTEAFFMAIIVLLIFFVTADKTMFRAMRVEFQPNLQASAKKNKSIKFTFVDLPDDKETPNSDARLYSDISRKAAGGSGAPSLKALSKGNTSSVVMHKAMKINQREMKQKPTQADRLSKGEKATRKQERGETGLEQAGAAGKQQAGQRMVSHEGFGYQFVVIALVFQVETVGHLEVIVVQFAERQEKRRMLPDKLAEGAHCDEARRIGVAGPDAAGVKPDPAS